MTPSSSIPSVPNLRDLGGHATRGGRWVRARAVYRSTDLSRLAAEDRASLAALGIRTVFDLRTAGEREANPDILPTGSAYEIGDVLADSPGPPPIALMEPLRDPALARELFGADRAAAYFDAKYREFVVLPSARAGFGRLFAMLADGGRRPALFHCTTGKDRTGWAAAVLLLALGVPEEAVVADYLASGPLLEPVFQPHLDAFAALGGDPDVIRPAIEVRRAYLDAGFDEMNRAFGSIDAYLERGLGLGARARAGLERTLLEPAPG
jgi:protein-tyrosine phosphatase